LFLPWIINKLKGWYVSNLRQIILTSKLKLKFLPLKVFGLLGFVKEVLRPEHPERPSRFFLENKPQKCFWFEGNLPSFVEEGSYVSFHYKNLVVDLHTPGLLTFFPQIPIPQSMIWGFLFLYEPHMYSQVRPRGAASPPRQTIFGLRWPLDSPEALLLGLLGLFVGSVAQPTWASVGPLPNLLGW
jgi:hypothetical protein